MATHVERSIEVDVPVRTAYDQWTQFEDFPRFMGGVQQVRQVGDTLTHWVAEIAGVRREWDAEILEQVPDQKVAWTATTGATNAGTVHFDAVGADRTRVRLTLDYEPEGVVEKIGDMLDVVERQAVADLDRFKQFIESRGSATGGWRGNVDDAGAPPVGADAAAAGGVAAADVARTGVQGDRGTAFGAVADDPTGQVDTSGTERTGTAAGAASTGAGVAGFGTDTGMSSSPTSGPFTGDPGGRIASHAGGDLVGDAGGRHEAWADRPGVRNGVTEAATDPVGESWDDPGTTTGAESRSAAAGTEEAFGAGRSGPGERREVADTAGEGVVQRNYADETLTTDEVVERDFANRDITGEGAVERDFANRDITERDIANRGIEEQGAATGMGGAHGTGTADDPDDPTRPSV